MSGVGKLIKRVGDAIFYGGDPAVQQEAKQAQQQQIAVQQKTLAKQEAAVNREETELAQKAQAALKARRGGGLRSLLSGSELGLTEQDGTKTKLGA
jgi:multidrug efflux pump subunit AcrA (membrane-fusion protein)